jgi:hypothetical protein
MSSLFVAVVRQNEIVSSHEVKSRANLSRPVVVAAQWVNQHEIMLGFEAVQERSLPDPWNQLDLSVGSARYLTANGANDSVFPVFPSLAF